MYDYARSGEEVEIKPRDVVIEKIELRNFDEINQTAEVLIKCSKGTYIRSIVHDLGQNLEVGGHLIKLVRTQAGKFFVDKSINIDEINDVETVLKNLINPIEMLNLVSIKIDENDCKLINNGMAIANKNNEIKDGDFVILVYNENIKAVGYVEKSVIKMKKVF